MEAQILGFHFTKLSGERFLNAKLPKNEKDRKITTNIEFTNVEKEKISMLNEEAVKISFSYVVTYEPKLAEVLFNGFLVVKMEKDAIKEVMKQWKKKKLAQGLQVPIYNVILSKCTIKALSLEEDLNLPPHQPLPRITPKQD